MLGKYFLLFILLICFNAVTCNVGLDRIIMTKFGLVRGVKALDGNYIIYMGLPYARVNKSNPFGESIPAPGFDGIFDAKHDSAGCIHIDKNNRRVGGLNCLKMNIYVPDSANYTSLPVLVFIYGEDFRTGKSSQLYYGPKFLMKQNSFIFVTFNYRSGPYGFLCPSIPDLPGNQGLRDQVTALRWIKDNIEDFGGDPERITLSGHGSGSICAHIHFLYTEEKLFSQVILASGTAFTPSIIKEPDNTDLLRLSEMAGFETQDPMQAINYLSKMNPRKVILYERRLRLTYSPCVEVYSETIENIIIDYPVNIQIVDNSINMLIGNALSEGEYIRKENSNTEDLANLITYYLGYEYDFDEYELAAVSNIVHRFYSDEKNNSIELKQGYSDFLSDFKFHYPTKKTIEQYLESGSKIFFYEFLYNGHRNYMQKKLNRKVNSAIHGDDLGYLFELRAPFINMTLINKEDQTMIDRLTSIWANFVKYGTPTPFSSNLLPIKWKPVTYISLYYMTIDSNMSLGKRPYNDRMAFWDLLNDMNGYKTNVVRQKLEDDFESSGDFIHI